MLDSPRPVSQRKLEANRANAQKSTGPRTEEGKARAALNALAHARTARRVMTVEDDPLHFVTFAKLIRADLRPQNYLQAMLVERAIDLLWKIQRAQEAQLACVGDEMERVLEFFEDQKSQGEASLPGDGQLLHGSRLLQQAVLGSDPEAAVYVRLDQYAERLQRALNSLLYRLRKEQALTGTGEPPADEEFEIKALRRAAKRTREPARRGGAQRMSEATAEAPGPARENGPTDAPATASAPGVNPETDDAPTQNLAGEPTADGGRAQFDGNPDASLN